VSAEADQSAPEISPATDSDDRKGGVKSAFSRFIRQARSECLGEDSHLAVGANPDVDGRLHFVLV